MSVPKGNELKVMEQLVQHEPLCPVDIHRLDPSLPLNGIYTVMDRMAATSLPSVTSWHEPRSGVRGHGVRMFKLTPHGRARYRAAKAAEAAMYGTAPNFNSLNPVLAE